MSHYENEENISEFYDYDSLEPEWPGVETDAFSMGLNPSYCGVDPMVPPDILTPISLPDSSFRPSPALSQQGYVQQDFGYGIGDSIPNHGLGITGLFPVGFPQSSSTPSANYAYGQDEFHYTINDSSRPSPQIPAAKRIKHTPSTQSRTQTSAREPLVNIAPDPEGVQRMEYERLNPKSPPLPIHPRPRAPGRGRRDPQAEEEDAFVENLRQQNVAWKHVREMFLERFKRDASEARLQMRLLRRRKERLERWEDHDIQLLVTAHNIWEEEKYRFLANKMKELGSSEDYSPEQCKAQLRLMETKRNRRELGIASPSAMSDPSNSPSIPPPASPLIRKGKRAWSESFDTEDL
ncbi:hypothetical protein N7495_008268 [Penicillium taxi]|uniref:uncharacterized protein n=1 Tax=Penicillium taxi TaxID=168475 RepID=UPI0025450D61|nr:uncharacterized protein N7495_008268 [Penicillium taxi]KAJ5888227.1 hypothetical protein N7495_008268 [Penicillium taxi]